MSFELTILGACSAIPTASKFTTSQLLNYNHNFFLIDCGEGTQIQLRENGIKIQGISHIFISHLHGDHFFGLIGLLSTMSLLGRKEELNLFAPEPLKQIIDIQLKASGTWLQYALSFTPLNFDVPQTLTIFKGLEVISFPVKHTVNCCGFIFKESIKPRKINKHQVAEHLVPTYWMQKLTMGEDFINEKGEIIPNSKLTLNPPASQKYAYCADCLYDETIVELIKDADLLYHEATFTHEMLDRAEKTKHSTAFQAGSIAKQANAKKLLIGHFSARYKNWDVLLNEAKTEFENTLIALQNSTYKI